MHTMYHVRAKGTYTPYSACTQPADVTLCILSSYSMMTAFSSRSYNIFAKRGFWNSVMEQSVVSVVFPLLVILACLSPACFSFTSVHQPTQQLANRIYSRHASANEHCKIDFSSIRRHLSHSIISFGVALTVLSPPSLAVELPLTYLSDDKSITFQHTTDLQFSPKPLKTHDKEILFKSESIKGFNAGVTVRTFVPLIMCHSIFYIFNIYPRRILRCYII